MKFKLVLISFLTVFMCISLLLIPPQTKNHNFPSLSAQSGKKYDFNYHISLYYTNDFHLEGLHTKNNGDVDANFGRDYESLVTESGISFYVLKNIQLGIDFRLISYYGGFLDNVVQNFHYAFDLPNAGRNYVDQNQIEIDIENNNNVILSLDHATVSFGDIDTWIKYTFFEKKWISLAMLGAFKIPTGNLSQISGSGYPDFAFGVLTDFKPVWILSFYLQAGVVFPLDFFIQSIPSNPYPMFNGLAGIELNPAKIFSLIVQFNFKSSPLRSNYSHWSSFYKGADYLSLPQINLLVGFVFKYKNFRWQIYFEEDSFTNAGTDFTINLSFSHTLHLRNIY